MCSLGAKIAKLLLFVINFGVWICGAVFLGLGIALAVDEDAWSWFEHISGNMSDGLYSAAVYTMIAVGTLLFLVGFVGCCGVCKGNKCLLTTYIVLVSILLCVELTAAILAIVFKDSLTEEVLGEMTEDVKLRYDGVYATDGTSTAWNSMQYNLKCCGASNFTDYDGSAWKVKFNEEVPIVCCAGTKYENKNYTISAGDKNTCMQDAASGRPEPTQLFTKGCYDGLFDWISDQADIIIGVMVGLGAVQLFGLLVACCVKSNLDED